MQITQQCKTLTKIPLFTGCVLSPYPHKYWKRNKNLMSDVPETSHRCYQVLSITGFSSTTEASFMLIHSVPPTPTLVERSFLKFSSFIFSCDLLSSATTQISMVVFQQRENNLNFGLYRFKVYFWQDSVTPKLDLTLEPHFPNHPPTK